MVRCAGAADTPKALGRHLPGYASDSAGLAPQAGCEKVRHEQAAQARPPADGSEHRPPRRPHGGRESAVGLSPHPRRADQARPRNRAVYRLWNPASCGYRPGAAPLRPDLAPVPAHPGSRDPRRRLPPRGHRAAEETVCPGVHRARHPPDAPGRRYREPHWRVDRTAGPQPRHEPRRAVRGRQVPDPRPRIELHPVL